MGDQDMKSPPPSQQKRENAQLIRTLAVASVAAIAITATGLILASRFRPVGVTIWLLLLAAVAVHFLVRWHARTTVYR
jgi:uncharacterized membrane protein